MARLRIKSLLVIGMMVCAASIGCSPDDNLIQGVHTPRVVEPSTARTRIEG